MNRPGLLIRTGLLLGSPLLVWFALPGRFSFWPLLWVALVPLLILAASAASAKKAFVCGLVSGLFFYALQLYWIVYVLHRYGGLHYSVAVPAMLLLLFYMSLYLGLFSLGFYLLLHSGQFFLLVFGAPSLWVGLDWLRSWLFGGFPWMDIGYGFWSDPRLLQAADLFGHHGYTFLIVFANLVIFLLFTTRVSSLQRVGAAVALASLLVAAGLYSAVRWRTVEELMLAAPTSTVGVVQGNIAQEQKWSPALRRAILDNYLKLSSGLQNNPPSLVIWPETALPFYPRNNELLQPIIDYLDESGTALLTGSPWYEIETGPAGQLIRNYNSALLLTGGGTLSGMYHKSHLVPYGEYVPLQQYLTFLAPLVEAAGNFSRGSVEQPLQSGAIQAGVLICYESIFGGIGRRWVENGANILINLTNDAWYGKSSAPYQSWAMSRFRAVETRRSLVRSANTGISGFIDPLGRIKAESPLFVPWSASLEMPLLGLETFFVRGGHLFAPGCAVLALVMVLGALIRRRGEAG